MPDNRPAPALRLSIDHTALADNWRTLDRLSGAAPAGAAIKADAYGIGAKAAVPTLREAGCRDFFVAHWAEVPPLLGLIDPGQIAVLHGPLTAADADFARAVGVRPVINSLHQAELWLASGGGACDVMVDTGINRLGLALTDLADPVVGQLQIDTLHSHLASADEDSPQNALQRDRWRQACALVPHRRASLANSAGICLGADYHGDLTRPGLALYGGIAHPALADAIRQVAYPEAAIMQVRTIAPGETVGYNATFTADRPLRTGVVSIGYADGYLRSWSGRGCFRAHGAALPVLGRVSMDMTVIDLSAAPQLREGDWVGLDYSLPQSALVSGLSQYELLTLLGTRFGR